MRQTRAQYPGATLGGQAATTPPLQLRGWARVWSVKHSHLFETTNQHVTVLIPCNIMQHHNKHVQMTLHDKWNTPHSIFRISLAVENPKPGVFCVWTSPSLGPKSLVKSGGQPVRESRHPRHSHSPVPLVALSPAQQESYLCHYVIMSYPEIPRPLWKETAELLSFPGIFVRSIPHLRVCFKSAETHRGFTGVKSPLFDDLESEVLKWSPDFFFENTIWKTEKMYDQLMTKKIVLPERMSMVSIQKSSGHHPIPSQNLPWIFQITVYYKQ